MTPILSWQDRRNAPLITSLRAHAADIHQRTGLFLSPHYGASKIRWCLDHNARVSAAAAQHTLAAGPLIGFLSQQLLEQHPLGVDPANAGRTLLWNLHTRTWDDQLAAWFGVPLSILPTVMPSYSEFGTLLTGARRIPLRVLQGDQPAALFADGWPQLDHIYVNIGTGAFIQRPCDQLPPELPRHLRSLVLLGLGRDIYTAEATVNGAAAAVDYLFTQHRRAPDTLLLARCLENTPAPPLFLNGIGGLAAPWWLPEFASHFIGENTDLEAQLAGVLESVLFLITVNIEHLATLAPRPTHIVLSGGWSHIDELARRLAALTGLSVGCQTQAEATARGTAFLAAAAPGTWLASGTRVVFAPHEIPSLRERYRQWRAAMRRYTALDY